MGQSQSKMRTVARHPVDSPDTRAIPIGQSGQDVPPETPRHPQDIETACQPEDAEPAASHQAGRSLDERPISSPNVDDNETATWIGAGSSPTTSTFQQTLSKMRQFSEVTRKPSLRWSPDSPAIPHPETQVAVFQKGWCGGKRALRILCSDLCKGLPRLAAESPGAWTEISDRIVIEPYELIFHNIAKIRKSETSRFGSGHWQKHLLFLVQHLESDTPDAWAKVSDIEAGCCKTITFDTVPLLYPRGATVLQNQDGSWRAYVIERHERKTSENIEVILIHAWYLDFDKTGKLLVPHPVVFELPKFDSERPIGTLELIPSQRFLNQKPNLMKVIRDRGAAYERFCGKVWYCEYRGDEWPRPSSQDPFRVIIDYVTSSRHTQNPGVSSVYEPDRSCAICVGKSIGLASHSSDTQHDAFRCTLKKTDDAQRQQDPETDQFEEPFLFCPPTLWAFSLHFKTWRRVSPHDLKKVSTRDEPFDRDLCMKFERKKAFKSIALEYRDILNLDRASEASTQRRRALNVLLCGNSGVGKTFTAECISEKFGFPLYAMTCGDLGDKPEELDLKLHETFLRGINWGAIILLDEVDEYVYSRSRNHQKRHYLIPILLRHLETSESLTIITMMHTEEAEEAFMGHLELMLHLPDFSFDDQKILWKRAIDSIPFPLQNGIDLHDFVDKRLESFENRAFTSLNARQITNAVRLATAIARGDEQHSLAHNLNVEHIKTTLKLGKEFKEYMGQKRISMFV